MVTCQEVVFFLSWPKFFQMFMTIAPKVPYFLFRFLSFALNPLPHPTPKKGKKRTLSFEGECLENNTNLLLSDTNSRQCHPIHCNIAIHKKVLLVLQIHMHSL